MLQDKTLQNPQIFLGKEIKVKYRQRVYGCILLEIFQKNCSVRLQTYRSKYNNLVVKRKLEQLRIPENLVKFEKLINLIKDITDKINSGERIPDIIINRYNNNKIILLRTLRKLTKDEIKYLIKYEIEVIHNYFDVVSVLVFNPFEVNHNYIEQLYKTEEETDYHNEDFLDVFIKHLRRD